MTAISSLSGIGAAGALADAGAPAGAQQAADQAIGAITDRVQAWVSALAPGGSPQSSVGGFVPDAAELARGGDIYGLRALAGELSERYGASPRQEGELSRALEGFARAAMVEAAGLHGGTPATQASGLDLARAASAGAAGDGIDGIAARLESATAALSARAG